MHQNSLIKRCIKALVFGIGGAIGSRVFMMLANIIISRIVGKEIYGKFSIVNDTVNLFVIFSGVGVSATLTRYISVAKEDKDKQGIYVRTLSRICVFLSIVLSCVLFIFARQISELSSGGYELTDYFKIVAVTVFFASMSSVEQSIMLGYERFLESSTVQLIRCFLFMLLGSLLSLRYGILGAAYALIITHCFQYIISVYLNKRYIRKNEIKLVYNFNNEIKEILIKFALPAFVSGLFVLPVNWICKAILIRYAGFGELALFSVAFQWMSYITYIPSQLGQMRPIYTDLYVNNKFSDLKKIFWKTTFYTTGVALLVGIAVVIGSEFILLWYGKGYEVGRNAFIFMIIAAIVYTAQVQTGFILQAFGKMWLSFIVNGMWAVSLVSVFWFLKEKGALGYSMAYVAAYVLIFVLQLCIVIKTFNGGVKWQKK